ncbi:Uncharacterised protein [Burkholderia pseudomallei]|nr:Uncharacterised protein [Burkholderia pseudomallei]VCR92362.1 Uncharacterised protein [Burkholderia pseudomallei]VCS15136.1 Uncharacterised protein [Burkholderia pseudomallei]VCS20592.1 Uncharacterised protein [Burkholderia pseudomallei]VCS44079.1 Uncharacterised protein [Burkholderia pseudomallei]
MNQPSTFAPIRPIDFPLSMLAMPETSVAKTSGAIIILTMCKKIVVTTPKSAAMAFAVASSAAY